ncbi:MAG: hypothetical protein JXQ83_14390 [Candidatus Glassbacteria bacterium]|nr:hypothetical protein [Candidatus Glassbacteria bacterium]
MVPILGVKADSGPRRTECGVGALIAWADMLWAVTYVSSRGGKYGTGTGLYRIDEDLGIEQVHVSNGVYANRLLHEQSNQVSIGPYLIDMQGNIRIIDSLLDHRLTATMTHLEDPNNKIYILSMEGPFFEVDVHSLQSRELFDLAGEFGIKGQPHFKGGCTSRGRVMVANNSYYSVGDTDGKLAEWDGKKWTILENKPFMDVSCRNNLGNVVFASGWDDSSAILKVLSDSGWSTYRLPKASHAYDHGWTTEWTRIREVETERYLMDCHGMFYEIACMAYGDKVWGVRPICTHLRIVPDFCSFRGMFVMAGNQASPVGSNLLSPQSQSGIWFGKTDDLWSLGKPQGWGGPWRKTPVKAGVPSDPYLMTGFEHKVLHLVQEGDSQVEVAVEVDFLGDGSWRRYLALGLAPGEYRHHEFPEGFSAHWVRLAADRDCLATAEFIYT